MTTGTPSSWLNWMGSTSLPNIYGGNFYAGDYTLSLWFDAKTLTASGTTVLFAYSGRTSSNDYGYNGLTWNDSEKKFVIGRGNFTATNMGFAYKEKSTLTNAATLLDRLNNVTLAVTSTNGFQTATVYLNGKLVETLAAYKGNMNNNVNPISYYVNNNLTYGNISLMNSKAQNLAEANSFALTGTIPEPSAFGLLAGIGALALVAARRRRRAK